MNRELKLLICDLDNTLYDWIGYFVPAFYSMVDKVIETIGGDKEVLLDDFKKVHQKYQNSEHPYSLLETKFIQKEFPGKSKLELKQLLEPAFKAFEISKKNYLKKYSYVSETLDILTKNNVLIVAHTESELFAVIDRIETLNLTKYFSKIYCRQRTQTEPFLNSYVKKRLENFPVKKVKELTYHQRKPEPSVLLEICDFYRVNPADAAYVGDSIARDIYMAKMAGVFSIWAAFGTRHPKNYFNDLVRITHWTEADIEREKRLAKKSKNVEPDFIAKYNFKEILQPFSLNKEFRSYEVG